MIIFSFILSLFVLKADASNNHSPLVFSSFTDQSITVDAHKYKKNIIFIDEHCPSCKALIKKIHKNCSAFKKDSFTIFATGDKKKLNKKVSKFIKKGVSVYTHSNIQTLLKLGLTAVPSYINNKKELFTGESESLKAFLNDKVCIK